MRCWWHAGQVLPGPPAIAPVAMPVPAGAPMHMAPSVEPAAATPFLEVNGMVTPEVLMDDEEYKEVTHYQRSPKSNNLLRHHCKAFELDVLS